MPGHGGTMHCVPASTRNAGFGTIRPSTITFSIGQLFTHVPSLLRLVHACNNYCIEQKLIGHIKLK